jgi:tRNA A37 methylthiotransferase MiaB
VAADTIPYRARAFLKVQDGCDFHCAYCVIPNVRGKSASVAGDDVVGRVRALVEDGYREIVLAGIHLSSYGRDLVPGSSLLELLERIEAVEGLGRVRLSSLDPRFLDGRLAAHVAASPRIAPHFHLSLQSGSARTLRAMGRASSPESYDALASHAAVSPNIAPHSLLSLQSGSATTLGTVGRRSSPESYDALASHAAVSPNIAPHSLLSLQSGSATTLGTVGRRSSPESYEEVLAGLRRRAPDAALGADVIVGFPGETDEEFERTREFIERSPLTYLHVFPFSPREGTPAAEMEPVDEAIKGERADALRALSRAKDLAFRAGFVGHGLEAVVIARKGRGAEALTGNNIRVFVPDCSVARCEFVTLRITEATADGTVGVTADGTSGAVSL